MPEHEVAHGIEHRHRDDAELEADHERARRMHILLTHDGDESACHCVLAGVEGHEDVVTVTATTDVDGVPLAVNAPTRQPITGATWTAPTDNGGNDAA